MKKHIHFPLLHASLVLLFHRSIVSHKLMNYMATAVYIRI